MPQAGQNCVNKGRGSQFARQGNRQSKSAGLAFDCAWRCYVAVAGCVLPTLAIASQVAGHGDWANHS